MNLKIFWPISAHKIITSFFAEDSTKSDTPNDADEIVPLPLAQLSASLAVLHRVLALLVVLVALLLEICHLPVHLFILELAAFSQVTFNEIPFSSILAVSPSAAEKVPVVSLPHLAADLSKLRLYLCEVLNCC